jgi:acetylornithine deacetylase/succinyl-diaminopimelate desuccinylase-like protein
MKLAAGYPRRRRARRVFAALGLLGLAGLTFDGAGLRTNAAAQVVPDLTEEELAVVRAHLQSPQLQQALEYIERHQADPSQLVSHWLGICNAYGPSGDEVYRANHIYKLFRIYGLDHVYIDDDNNVIGIRPGTGGEPKVVLNAHHDVVPLWPKDQPIEAFYENGRIYCPGAGDDIHGVLALVMILRAMEAANLETNGDVWFVTLSGEETGVWGAENFARRNYPHNIDWRNGDAVVQIHGSAGVGVSSGSVPVRNMASLRFFTPFERRIEGQPGADRRWRVGHAVDVLTRTIVRIRSELTDPRPDCLRCPGVESEEGAEWYINAAHIESHPVRNRPASEALVRFDLRARDKSRLHDVRAGIMRIAGEVCHELETTGFPPHGYTDRCYFTFNLDREYGNEEAVPEFDRVNSRQVRMVAAAAHALYGFEPEIAPANGCGDCVGMYDAGLPSLSFRGNVIDHGGGRIERGPGGRQGGHDVTESQTVEVIWSGIKHGLVFAASYSGMPGVGVADDD